MAIKVVNLDQTDLTILPDSISYYEDNILKQLDDVLLKYSSADAMLSYHYPVNSIIEIANSDYDPNNFLPGTWQRFGEGRTHICANNDTALLETSIGTFNHLLTVEELPSHQHRLGYNSDDRQRKASSWVDTGYGSNYNTRYYTRNTGGGLKHNNTMPYIVTFSWKRVS